MYVMYVSFHFRSLSPKCADRHRLMEKKRDKLLPSTSWTKHPGCNESLTRGARHVKTHTIHLNLCVDLRPFMVIAIAKGMVCGGRGTQLRKPSLFTNLSSAEEARCRVL